MYNKKATYKKKTTSSDKHTVAVVKRVLDRQEETKSAMSRIQALAVTEGLTYASNLCGAVAQGITAEQVIGEKIYLKNLNFIAKLNTSNALGPKQIRVMVVSSKEKLTTSTNFSLISNSSIWRTAVLPADMTIAHADLHKVDVHYDKVYNFNPSLSANDSQVRHISFRVPFNKTMYYESDNANYFKNKNIYLILTSYQNGGLNVPVEFDSVLAVNFKDS